MAILKFRIYWEEDESVYRDLEIKHTQTFFDLHKSLLKCFDFDDKHRATFFRSNDLWKQGREISLENYEDRVYKTEPLIMEATAVGSEITDPNQKFIYLYDFHKHWTFLVELIGINKHENQSREYPHCLKAEGISPSQYGTKGLVNEKLAEIEEKYDINTSQIATGYSEEGEDDEDQIEEDEEEDDEIEL